MSNNQRWIIEKLRSLDDPLFWVTFIPLVLLKLIVFHFAATRYLLYGSHAILGMNFEIVESFSDFTFYYLNFVRAFVQGNLPYTEALFMYEGTQTYIYPPLFVYMLGIFYFVPSELLFPDIQITALALGRNLDFLRVGFTFIFFDLATCVVIYAAAKHLTQRRAIPLVVLFAFALNPISLWWGNYLWLSTPIHTFFLVLGFYFMIRGDLRWAIVWVTVATMVKQTAAILLPVILFLEFRKGVKPLLFSLGIMLSIAGALSLPYLVLYPITYIESILRASGGYWFYDALPPATNPIPISVLAFNWPEPFKFLAFQVIVNGIPWVAFLVLFWLIAYWIPEQPFAEYQSQLVLLALLLSLTAHIFFPRGIYKFYLIALLPFLILFGASLQGPILLETTSSISLESRFHRIFQYLPYRLVKNVKRFQVLGSRIVNNKATWWFVLAGLISIGLWTVHRYHTHLLLLTLFLILLLYGWYHFLWTPRKLKKLSSGDESSK